MMRSLALAFGLNRSPQVAASPSSMPSSVNGTKYYKAIGEHPALTVKAARDDAKQWAGKASRWKQEGFPPDKNPFANPKRVRTTTPLFKELAEAYIQNHLLHPEDGALNPNAPNMTLGSC